MLHNGEQEERAQSWNTSIVPEELSIFLKLILQLGKKNSPAFLYIGKVTKSLNRIEEGYKEGIIYKICFINSACVDNNHSNRSIIKNNLDNNANNYSAIKLHSNFDMVKFQRQGINQQGINKLTNKEWIDNKIPQLNPKFLEWFRGFSEGDGSFFIVQSFSIFSINLHIADLPLLVEIQTQLNIGKITLNKKSDSAIFRVKSEKEIWLLIEIFNGKIFLRKKQIQFEAWCKNYSRKTKVNIELKPFTFIPTLNDSWISGLIDAEGSCKVFVTRGRVSSTGNQTLSITQNITVSQTDAEREFIYLSKITGGGSCCYL